MRTADPLLSSVSAPAPICAESPKEKRRRHSLSIPGFVMSVFSLAYTRISRKPAAPRLRSCFQRLARTNIKPLGRHASPLSDMDPVPHLDNFAPTSSSHGLRLFSDHAPATHDPTLLVHGGAWAIPPTRQPPTKQAFDARSKPATKSLPAAAPPLDAVEAQSPSSKTTLPSTPAEAAFSPPTAACNSTRCSWTADA